MIKRFDQFLEQISKWGIMICLFFMLSFTLASIVLRWFGISFHWIDPVVRHFVFLAAFLGGSLATGKGQNIKIDLLSRYLELKNMPKIKKNLARITSITTLLISMILVKASWDFVKVEAEFGKEVFAGVHSSVLVGIIPLGFALISLRLVCRIYLYTNEENITKPQSVQKG